MLSFCEKQENLLDFVLACSTQTQFMNAIVWLGTTALNWKCDRHGYIDSSIVTDSEFMYIMRSEMSRKQG